MSREAGLFESAKGSPLRGYIMLKKGGGNVPPQWISRSQTSRQGRQKAVANAFRKRGIEGIATIEEWEVAYKKECFYRGIRILMELDRNGKSKL
jgi:hypothetical protein